MKPRLQMCITDCTLYLILWYYIYPSALSECSPTEEGERHPSPRGCAYFFECHKGKESELKCPWFTNFDPKKRDCRISFLVDCVANDSLPQVEQESPKLSEDVKSNSNLSDEQQRNEERPQAPNRSKKKGRKRKKQKKKQNSSKPVLNLNVTRNRQPELEGLVTILKYSDSEDQYEVEFYKKINVSSQVPAREVVKVFMDYN